MARPGPPPKPSALRVLDGGASHRPPPKHEPKPPTHIPPCPGHLKPEARKEWRRVVKQLAMLNMVTHLDRAVLAGYCQAWARWVEAERKVSELGEIVKTKGGNVIQNPHLAVANRAYDQMKAAAAEFGMTPSARTRIMALPAGGSSVNRFSRNGRKPD